MNTERITSIRLLFGLLLVAWGCDKKADPPLRGQTNVTMTFYGKAVAEDGTPLPGARFDFRVEAYPEGWTFDRRDQKNDVSEVTATSDANGQFQFTVTACTLRRLTAEKTGYRHFCDLDHESRPTSLGISNDYYSLIEWGYVKYKSDAAHPAVFVFVKDGAVAVSALPCKGGYRSSGKNWTPNKPGWPRKPSLRDVVHKQATPVPGAK